MTTVFITFPYRNEISKNCFSISKLNAPTSLMKKQGYGKGYLYAHDYEGNFVVQEFLPEKLTGTILFDPGNNPREAEMRQRLKQLWGKKYNY